MSGLVFISGASSGLGAALADTLPFEARCIDISRRGAAGLESVRADLSSPEGWDRAAEAFERELDGFRGERAVFVHAAGTLEPIELAAGAGADAYRRAILLNAAAGPVLGQAFLSALGRARTRATLAMVSSGAAFLVYPGWSVYGPGKAALDHWVRTVAAEPAPPRGSACRLLSIAPGILDTAMQERARSQDAERFGWVEEFRQLKRGGSLREPREAAREIWEILLGDAPSGSVIDLHRPAGSDDVD